jgi:VIT1/CCC1 family predicted Fe2+/Mn2+ transporter
MDALSTKNRPIQDHDPKPEQSVQSSEGHSLVRLFRTAVFGLLSAIAAIFTTMLPMPDGWRSFWLIICLCTFALAVTGIVRFEGGYKR